MKTTKITTIITSLILVMFLSFASNANTSVMYSGDLTKSAINNVTAGNNSDSEPVSSLNTENEFSYLRFDVNDFSSNNEVEEVSASSFDQLRFDVNDFIEADNSDISELPEMNEFNYLHFDVNNYSESVIDETTEMPANDYDYLRFDVNRFVSPVTSEIDELPLTK